MKWLMISFLIILSSFNFSFKIEDHQLHTLKIENSKSITWIYNNIESEGTLGSFNILPKDSLIEKIDNKLNNEKCTTAKSFFYFSIGLYEALCIGFGYNINEEWGISFRTNVFLLRSSFLYNTAVGIGFKVHKRIFQKSKLRLFDTINFEVGIGSNNFKHDLTRCKEVQFNLSKENINDLGFNFYYNIGIGYSKENRKGTLLLPAIKFGTIYNL